MAEGNDLIRSGTQGTLAGAGHQGLKGGQSRG
ncbi:hypothetical protein AF72_08065 [Xylella taiwanensis]|uniref:Uncharacterized protein n=1 Tax=Xylella taiwanensis TaxID=1444770 RepID=Z9JHT7_9GAMM|nr:hypothetical protein AF72_08065 [Xylella taiwanensis]